MNLNCYNPGPWRSKFKTRTPLLPRDFLSRVAAGRCEDRKFLLTASQQAKQNVTSGWCLAVSNIFFIRILWSAHNFFVNHFSKPCSHRVHVQDQVRVVVRKKRGLCWKNSQVADPPHFGLHQKITILNKLNRHQEVGLGQTPPRLWSRLSWWSRWS